MATLTRRDLDAIARVAQSEVDGFRSRGYADWEGAVKAVADTIVNRADSSQFPSSISGVVNAKNQFSAVSGIKGASGTWDKLPAANRDTMAAIENWAVERANGGPSPIGGAVNFANPYSSSAKNRKAWVDEMVANAVAVYGKDAAKFVHYHGLAPGFQPSFGTVELDPALEGYLGDPVYNAEAFRWQKADYAPWTPGAPTKDIGPTPPAAVTGLGSMTLKRGPGQNPNVAELQKTLFALGYNVDTIDGYFGPQTEAAVKAYQKASNLPTTGKVDAKTHSFIDPTYEEINSVTGAMSLQPDMAVDEFNVGAMGRPPATPATATMPSYGPDDMGAGMINRPIGIDEVRPRPNPTLAAASTTDAASIAPDFAETDFNVGAMGRPSPSAPTAPSNKQKQAASQVNRAAMERRGEPAITPEQVTASSRQNVLGNNPELRASTTPAATLAARPSPAALDAYRAPTTSELDSADTLTRKDMDATAQTRAGVAAGPLSVSDRVKAIAKEVAARTDLTKAEKLDYARAALDQSMGFPADPSLKVKSSIVSEIAAAATGPAKSASAAPIPRPSPIAPGTPASAASASLAIPDRVTAAQSGFRPTVNQSPPMPRPNPVEDLNPKTPPKSYPNGPVPVANPLRDNFDPSQQQPVSAAPGAARNASINTLMSDAFGNLPTPARDDALYDSLDGRYSPGNSPWGPISPEDDPRVTQSATPDAASLPRLTNRLEKQNLSAPPDARPTIGDPVMGDTRYGYGAGAPGQAGIGISTQKDLLDLMGAQMGPVSSDVGMYYDAPQSASRPSPAQQSEVVTGKNYGYGLDPQYDLGKAALAAAGSGLPGLVGYGIGATIGGGTGTKFDMAIADAKEARNPSGVPATSQVYEQAYEMSPSQGSYPINSPLSAPAPSTYAAAVPGMLDVQPAFGADKPLDAMTPTELSAYMAANPYGFGSPIAPPVPQAQLVAPPPPQVAGVASTRVAGAARPSPYGQWSSDIARMSSGMQPGSVSVSRNRPSVGFSNMVSGRDGYGHSVSSYTGQNGVQHNTTQIGRGSFYSRDSSGSRSDSGGRSGGSNGGRASSGGGSANGRSGSSSNARNR